MNDDDIDGLVANAEPSTEGATAPSLLPLMAELREQIITDAPRHTGATTATPLARLGQRHRHNGHSAAAPRHDRRYRAAAIAAAVAAIAAVGVGLWPGSTQSAWAGWTPDAQPASLSDVEAIGDACTSALADHGSAGPGRPIAVDIRGDGGFVVFESGATCSAHREEGPSAFKVRTTSCCASSNVYEDALDRLAPTESLVSVLAAESNDPANSFVWGVRSPDIDGVTIDTPYGPVEATVSGAVWLAWWPEATGLDLSVTGTSADGRVLVADTFGALQLDGAGDDGPDGASAEDRARQLLDELRVSGSSEAQSILQDGEVTENEFEEVARAAVACADEAGASLSLRESNGGGYDLTYQSEHSEIVEDCISPLFDEISVAWAAQNTIRDSAG